MTPGGRGEPRAWAPRARRLDAELAGGRHPLRPLDGGWWTGDRAAGAGHRLPAVPSTAARALPDPRSPVPARGRPRTLAHSSTTPPSPGATPAGAVPTSPTRCSTSSTSAPSPPRAPSTRPSARLDHLVDLGVTAVELHAGGRVPRRRAAGATTVSTSTPPTTPTAAPRGCSGWSTPATPGASPSVLDVVYNHLGPDGNYLGELRALLHRSLPHAVGRGGQLRRRRTATRCAASSSTTP